MADTILKTWIAKRLGVDGYENQEFLKEDGGAVAVKVKQKVLWAGNLSIVGSTETLDGAEKFSNWDNVMFICNLRSDTGTGVKTTQLMSLKDFINGSAIDFFSDTGRLSISKDNDTQFTLQSKTMALANVTTVIGIKL